MSDSDSFSELVMELAEEFLERYRNGERPPLAEYIEKHPQLADEIREVFPAMAMMENIAIDDESLAGAGEGGTAPEPELKQIGDFRILREAERSDRTITDVCREHQISEQTFHRWKRELGMLEVDQARQLRELKKENERLKRMLADEMLGKELLREALEKKL